MLLLVFYSKFFCRVGLSLMARVLLRQFGSLSERGDEAAMVSDDPLGAVPTPPAKVPVTPSSEEGVIEAELKREECVTEMLLPGQNQ